MNLNYCNSDLDGNFQINTSPEAILEFSYVGYLQEEQKAAHRLDIKMLPDLKSLEEVVVVGYGIQKKSDLTGSITFVKAEDIQNRAITNINEAFSGKASGVQAYSSSGKPGSIWLMPMVQQAEKLSCHILTL